MIQNSSNDRDGDGDDDRQGDGEDTGNQASDRLGQDMVITQLGRSRAPQNTLNSKSGIMHVRIYVYLL